MTDIDWSKAPEGTTHWQPENKILRAAWLKKTDSTWYFKLYDFDQGTWKAFSGPGTSLGDVVARPTAAPVWNGPEDGLPPVGLEFEYRHGVHAWKKGEALYIGAIYVILKSEHGGEQHYYLTDMQFRPIRTAEQLAAEERERGVLELMNWVVSSLGKSHLVRMPFKPFWESAYDEGLRAPEATK